LLVEKGIPFFAQNRKFNWIDIGSVKDFWSVSQSVMMGGLAQMSIPGIQIEEGIWAGLNTRIDWKGTVIEGPVYIGAGTQIEAGCKIIGPTWIGHGSHICAGAHIVRSVLFEYTHIAADVHLEEKIVFKDYSVDRFGTMLHVSQLETKDWGNARDRRATPVNHSVEKRKASVL
jgi:mannose-1-phosphate guanylyltransferase